MSTTNVHFSDKTINIEKERANKYLSAKSVPKAFDSESSLNSNTSFIPNNSLVTPDNSFSQYPPSSPVQNKAEVDQNITTYHNYEDDQKMKGIPQENFPADEIYDKVSNQDSLLQPESESNTTLKEKLTVSWEDCLSHSKENMYSHIERPESVYTVGSNDTGFHEDGELEAESGMTTSMDSTDGTKRLSSTSRDSCIVIDEVDGYKLAESNSTSGYSTGLSDSCCNDRAEDDLSNKPSTDSELQDSVGPCDSEDAFSLHDNSLGSKDAEMMNAEVSDVTTETATAIYNDSTSDALCETMVEDTTLTEINELLMSPEENVLIVTEETNDTTDPSRIDGLSGTLKQSMNPIPNSLDNSTAQSTPEKKSNITRSKTDAQRNSTPMAVANRVTKASRLCDTEADKKQIAKSPKKNVMSKIKAMIEATSCKTVNKSKSEGPPVSRRTVSVPKKSRWEAVTSKIAASLAEEKTKPKAKREIRSRVDTNLTSTRQQVATCKSPKLDSSRLSNCGDGSMSPVSVSSKDRKPLSERNSASNSVREGRVRLSRETKQRPKSPRPGLALARSRSASPVAVSESSTTSVSVNSHNSRSKIAHWKGSNSTIASSVPPPPSVAAKRPPLVVASKITTTAQQSNRAATSRVVTKKPLTVPKIRITPSAHTSGRSPSPSISTRNNSRQSRTLKEQTGVRNAHTTTKPVRPPMWLSKAELTQEIQRLGNLCEARTKELNRLKMETKHVSAGFDAFATLFKYMVEDMSALSVPMLSEDLEKTLKQLELAKQDLAYYEREVEEMKAHHCQELNDLSNKLFEVFQGEVTELSAKHQEEMNILQQEHRKQIENLTSSFNVSSEESLAKHEALISKLQQELISQREELQMFQEKEIVDLEEKHTLNTKTLREHIEQLQKKCAELKQHSMGMEDAMRKDTDTKLQWVTSRKVDLEKEVESLKAVLEMKNKELHTIRVQNLEMEKQLEELPLAREKIKMLQARAEDLEALMIEKTKLERKLSTENQQMRDTYEKEAKVNRRLSMENEELQWRLRQADNSLISSSFTDVPEYPEDIENGSISPIKSPGSEKMSRSVFFTYVDKDDTSSPKSNYKRISSSFSASYKTSPAKSSKSPPVPSPSRGKSNSEPPVLNTTPRKVSRQLSNKQKGTPKRQRSGSDCTKTNGEHGEVVFLSITGSMASSVSSECSVFGQKDQLLEEHKEQIMESLEILREQRSMEQQAMSEEQWCNDGTNLKSPNLEEDMSRSSEFSDPKTYYHMTFPVLKEAGIADCDMEDNGKGISHHDSTVVQPIHSTLERHDDTIDNCEVHLLPSDSSHGASSQVIENNGDTRQEVNATPFLSIDDIQVKEQSKEQDRWQTI